MNDDCFITEIKRIWDNYVSVHHPNIDYSIVSELEAYYETGYLTTEYDRLMEKMCYFLQLGGIDLIRSISDKPSNCNTLIVDCRKQLLQNNVLSKETIEFGINAVTKILELDQAIIDEGSNETIIVEQGRIIDYHISGNNVFFSATDKGLFRYDMKNAQQFKISELTLKNIAVNKNTVLGYKSGILYGVDYKKNNEKVIISSKKISAFELDGETIWFFAINDGVYYYNMDSGDYRMVIDKGYQDLDASFIRCNGYLYVNLSGTVYSLNTEPPERIQGFRYRTSSQSIYISDKHLFFVKDKRIHRCGFEGEFDQSLTDQETFEFVVKDGTIYYTSPDGLYKINEDGCNNTKLSSGHVRDLKIIGNSVYYLKDEGLYRYLEGR